MQVSELMDILKECDPTDLVVMSKDAEGNGYSVLVDTNHQDYFFHADDEAIYEEEFIGTKPCIVLWPI